MHDAPPDISGLGASWQLVGATGNLEAGKGGGRVGGGGGGGGERVGGASLTLHPTSSQLPLASFHTKQENGNYLQFPWKNMCFYRPNLPFPWQIKPRQIGPLANWAPSDFCGKLGPGRLGPGKLGPGRGHDKGHR